MSTAALRGHVKKYLSGFHEILCAGNEILSRGNEINIFFTCPLSAAVTEYTYKERKKDLY